MVIQLFENKILVYSTWWRHQMETFSALLALVRGIHRSPVNSPHKGQWRWALMFSLICAWINCWVNNGDAGDLRRHSTHYDVTVMMLITWGRTSTRVLPIPAREQTMSLIFWVFCKTYYLDKWYCADTLLFGMYDIIRWRHEHCQIKKAIEGTHSTGLYRFGRRS